MTRIPILDIGFDPLDEAAAAALLFAHIQEKRKENGTASLPALRVVTPNPLTVLYAREHPDFAEILRGADLSLADGQGIVFAAARRGTPLPGRATGIGTAQRLFSLLAGVGGTVFLLGGKPGVAARAAKRLEQAYPGLSVCGAGDGYFSGAREPELLAELARKRPDVLCVCLGAPKQEKFMAAHDLPCAVAMGLGGSVDVWAGNLRRAPAVFQRAGLEWLWRMLRQPRRFLALPRLIKFRFLTR